LIKLKIKFKIKILVAWSIFEGWLDQKQIIYFVWPYCSDCQLRFIATFLESRAGLEITVSHWPFSDQFQHLADQNPFWSANFTVHFQWDQ